MKSSKIILALLSLTLLSSCEKSNQLNEKSISENVLNSTNQDYLKNIEYSNLVDIATQKEVKEALEKSGITLDEINTFFDDVANFNQTVGEVGMVKNGFQTSDNLKPAYDFVAIDKRWIEKNPIFLGYNCRITTYGMMKDFVNIQNPEIQNAGNLFPDEDALSNNPKKVFNKEEMENFRALFSQIPTALHQDINKHIEVVKKNWKEKGITFPHKGDTSKASFIFVFFHSYFSEEENNLFIGHTGVLVPTKEGKLLFIEKLAFTEPYQVIKFNNRTELNDYLMNRYDIEWNQPTAHPFILENDELLEGYRPNPNKGK